MFRRRHTISLGSEWSRGQSRDYRVILFSGQGWDGQLYPLKTEAEIPNSEEVDGLFLELDVGPNASTVVGVCFNCTTGLPFTEVHAASGYLTFDERIHLLSGLHTAKSKDHTKTCLWGRVFCIVQNVEISSLSSSYAEIQYRRILIR